MDLPPVGKFFHVDDDPEREAEFCSVLFVDIVGFTKQPEERQLEMFKRLHAAAAALPSLTNYPPDGYDVIPSGDGMAICFFGRFSTQGWKLPLLVSVDLQRELAEDDFRLRQGMALGRAFRLKDPTNGTQNVIGNAINRAARVMGFGDENHILCDEGYYRTAFHNSWQYRGFFERKYSTKGKHDEPFDIWNVIHMESSGVIRGNPAEPSYVREHPAEPSARVAQPVAPARAANGAEFPVGRRVTARQHNHQQVPTDSLNLDLGTLVVRCRTDPSTANRPQKGYLFAHATNHGRPIDPRRGHPYPNVLAVSIHPTGPSWEFWLADDRGKDRYLQLAKNTEPGEHVLVARWDRKGHRASIAVDGAEETQDDVTTFPSEKAKFATIGTWPWDLDIFYAECELGTLRIYDEWLDLDDLWIAASAQPP